MDVELGSQPGGTFVVSAVSHPSHRRPGCPLTKVRARLNTHSSSFSPVLFPSPSSNTPTFTQPPYAAVDLVHILIWQASASAIAIHKRGSAKCVSPSMIAGVPSERRDVPLPRKLLASRLCHLRLPSNLQGAI